MKFRLRSAHRGLTGCGLRHGPIGRLPCRAGLGDWALRPPVLPMHGRVSGRSATADPRIDRSGRRMFERRPGGAPLPGARATRDRRLDSSPNLPRIPSNSPGIRPESAPNPPRTPRQRRLPAMRAPFERRSVRGDSVVRLGIRARPFEPPTHRPASDDPARSPPSQARSGVPAAPARLAESTRDLTVRCPFGTRALPRLPRSPAAGAVRETCLIIRHSRYSWIPRNSPFQLIERFSS